MDNNEREEERDAYLAQINEENERRRRNAAIAAAMERAYRYAAELAAYSPVQPDDGYGDPYSNDFPVANDGVPLTSDYNNVASAAAARARQREKAEALAARYNDIQSGRYAERTTPSGYNYGGQPHPKAYEDAAYRTPREAVRGAYPENRYNEELADDVGARSLGLPPDAPSYRGAIDYLTGAPFGHRLFPYEKGSASDNDYTLRHRAGYKQPYHNSKLDARPWEVDADAPPGRQYNVGYNRAKRAVEAREKERERQKRYDDYVKRHSDQ